MRTMDSPEARGAGATDVDPAQAARSAPTAPAILVRGLRVAFGRNEVLRGIDLDVEPGRILGYIGANGAGKTTTVKVLTGILSDFAGRVEVCGIDVAADPIGVKRRIGYVPETAALYEQLTPFEYLELVGEMFGIPSQRLRSRADELLMLFGLGGHEHARMATFSKGMRQKVLIVGGLIHDPDVVFLDEPLSGLDANSALMLKELIAGLARAGKTVFYCSHLLDVVERVCDRIAIVDDGRVVASGTFQELRAERIDASLEGIFAELTSSGDPEQVARRILEVMRS